MTSKEKLKNTTKCVKGRPKKTTFNLEEMCIIIKECAASGVAELKFGDLNVSFFDRKEKERAVFDQSSSDYDHPGPEKIEEIISNQEELTESDELNHRDTQMMTMAIEDPSKFEDMLVHDEVEDIPEGDEDASTD